MSDPVNLNYRRSVAAEDATLLSVEDVLRAALDDSVDGHWTKALLVLYRPGENRDFVVDMRCAGVTTLEARGLMLSWIREEIRED